MQRIGDALPPRGRRRPTPDERGSRRHDEQLPRRTLEEMAIAEIAILRDYHPILRVRYPDNLGISGRVPVREVAGVDGLMASIV